MNNFIEIAKKRYSVRSYQDKKVEEEKVYKILEAADPERHSQTRIPVGEMVSYETI